MYPRNVTFTAIPAKHNLRNVILETKNSTKHLLRYSFTFRQFSLRNVLQNATNLRKEILQFIEKDDIISILRRNILSVPKNLKNQSATIIRTWTHQCECVVAQRFRRGQQMFCLYSKLWEERALKEFLMRLKQQVAKCGKELMLGAVGVTVYNWESNRISDNEIQNHVNEIEYMKLLKDNTMVCITCKNANKDLKTNTVNSKCNCRDNKYIYMAYDNWTVFIEKQDMIVWRRLHESGSYEYKVYGSFNDVCAEDFLNVQIDIEYRKKWDTTAVVLDVVEKDPNPETNCDVVYWEMLWPRLFANRDYVFKRRFMVHKNTKTILLVSKHTEHPKCPATNDKHRVEKYWSNMVIRPHADYRSPGLEFGLTYFDNPGVNIPAAVTAWVAYRAMPEFLNRLRDAARNYQSYCDSTGCLRLFKAYEFVNAVASEDETTEENADDARKSAVIIEKCPGIDIMTSPSPILQADISKHNYWKYLQPTYYFS